MGPADPDAEVRPDLIAVDPTAAEPGDVVALTFPEETGRGILFVLEERIGDTWAHRYNLTSDGTAGDRRGAWYLPTHNRTWWSPPSESGVPGPTTCPSPRPPNPASIGSVPGTPVTSSVH